jgi:hypothetical protein
VEPDDGRLNQKGDRGAKDESPEEIAQQKEDGDRDDERHDAEPDL